MKRTHTCGQLAKKEVDKNVTLQGWVNSRRDHGGVIFIDLRDRYGLTQIVINPDNRFFSTADKLRREDCIEVSGKVRLRPKGMENPSLLTGEIEVLIDSLDVLNKSETPPLEVDDRIAANEEIRLKYRYLDLRRPIMQKHLLIRHKAAQAAREFLSDDGFLEIETPLLIRSTPEGARDYIVPSRVHPGMIYSLPQSPQLYKQILMVSGVDRYFQIARCLRDEDLRADRQPEFTQIDLEMSFVEQQDVLDVVERMVKHIVEKTIGKNITEKFHVMQYEEAISKYGTDKPDLRFGMELVDVTDIAKESDFSIFKQAPLVKCLPCLHDFTRADIDKLIEWAKQEGSKGLAWMRLKNGKLESSIVKYFNEGTQKKLIERAKIKEGILFFIADTKKNTNAVLSKLRVKLGHDLRLIKENDLRFVWMLDFPLFEWNEEEEKWDPAHHMFTMPKKEHLEFLEKNPEKVYASLYDLVLNGVELGSGSIRVHDPAIQERIMKVVGFPKQEAEKRFGFLLESFKYGAPPHGGFAVGFDRLVALLLGINDIREVIAFPKTKAAECPMDSCPSPPDEKTLKELHMKFEAGIKK